MSRKVKLILASWICLVFFFSNVVMVYAGFPDTENHWASQEISKWSEAGLLNGNDDGTFKPDDPITRAEFLSVICRLFNYIEKSGTTFPDVKAGTWYADDISKAYAAGIITGDDKGNVNPGSKISRQEAAVVMYRAFDLKVNNSNATDKFLDSAGIASWSRDAVSAMVENAYINGKPGNIFAPKDNLTRAEAVKIINNMVSGLKNASGTYTGNVTGNLLVNTDGVVLNDMTISGNLYITQGVGEGEVTLNNVVVKGKTFVKGGGENSIVLNNTSLEGTLVIIKEGGKIRIVAKGSTIYQVLIWNQEQNFWRTVLPEKASGMLKLLKSHPVRKSSWTATLKT